MLPSHPNGRATLVKAISFSVAGKVGLFDWGIIWLHQAGNLAEENLPLSYSLAMKMYSVFL
jgi:hypothetical protein